MRNNIDEIFSRIVEKDRELAGILGNFAERFLEETHYNNEEIDGNHKRSKRQLRDYPKLANGIIDRITNGTQINLYPSDLIGKCHPICVCKAFGKWNSYKLGFKGTAKYLLNNYFKGCGKINKSILIFTFAWDELDFLEKFKEEFDNYTRQGKTICVVLITLNGMSIQYLR